MTSWFDRLFIVVMGLFLAGMVMLSGEALPPAAAVEQAGAVALPFGLTLADLCSPW